MRVLVQKERNSRWLNRSVVMILVAMIAIDLAIYFRPDNGSKAEEARVAQAIERAQKEQAKLAQQLRVEKEEAKANADRLVGKIDGLEKEAERKLGELARSLDRQKAEFDRQAAEQTQWIGRMAEQLDHTRRDLAVANDRVKHLPRVGVRVVIPKADVPDLKNARAYLARSWLQLNKGATDQAMADAEEALRLDPTLAEAHLIRTEVFARKGKPEQSRAERRRPSPHFAGAGSHRSKSATMSRESPISNASFVRRPTIMRHTSGARKVTTFALTIRTRSRNTRRRSRLSPTINRPTTTGAWFILRSAITPPRCLISIARSGSIRSSRRLT